MNEKLSLSREIKLLILQILKQGNVTKDQADALVNFFVNNELIKQVTIKFVNFNDNEK